MSIVEMLEVEHLTSMDILAKILRIAEAKEIGQLELERMAGLPANRISKWRAGQGEPKISHALRLARALAVSLEYLADDQMDAIPPDPTQEDRELLNFCRRIGIENAWRRLAVILPDEDDVRRNPPKATSADGSPTYGEELRRRETDFRSRRTS